MLPTASEANPLGELKVASVPVPLRLPDTPALPANVLTTPDGVILRIKLLPGSATYRLPAASVVNPSGYLKVASVPVPLRLPVTPAFPAKVLTTPDWVILRIKLLYWSATYTLPAASVATPTGLLKVASVPVPLRLPDTPALPAKVLTKPSGVILRIK